MHTRTRLSSSPVVLMLTIVLLMVGCGSSGTGDGTPPDATGEVTPPDAITGVVSRAAKAAETGSGRWAKVRFRNQSCK